MIAAARLSNAKSTATALNAIAPQSTIFSTIRWIAAADRHDRWEDAAQQRAAGKPADVRVVVDVERRPEHERQHDVEHDDRHRVVAHRVRDPDRDVLSLHPSDHEEQADQTRDPA